MADVITVDSRLSLPAIVAGGITAFIVDLAFMLLGTGLAMALFRFEAGEDMGTIGYIASALFLIIGAFVSYAAGGFVAGYFAPHTNVTNSRLHGFGAFALAGLLMAFFLGTTAATGLGMFANASSTYVATTGRAPVVTDARRAPTAPTRVTRAEAREAAGDVRRASAGTFLTLFVLLVEGAVAAYWAGGEAHLRLARRGAGSVPRDQYRAA